MEVRLVVTNDNASAKQVRLGSETVIGRSRECNLRIASGQVSRQHCIIRVEESRVLVRDLGSANGTEIDGVTIPPEIDIPVAPGSTLVVGPLKFVFEFTPDPPKELDENEELQSTTEDISPIPTGFLPKVIDEETKDYGPSLNRQRRTVGLGGEEPDSGQLDFMEGQPSSPVALVRGSPEFPPEGSSLLSNDETVFDRDLAERAREAGLPPGGASPGLESGTDLLAEGDGAFAPPPFAEQTANAPHDPHAILADGLSEEPTDEVDKGNTEGPGNRKGWKVFGLLKRRETPDGKGKKSKSPAKGASKNPPATASESADPPAPEVDADLHDFFRKNEP